VKLIVQPDAGDQPIISAIRHAKRMVDILIFRLDDHRLTHALEKAIERGVGVRVLIAYKNRGGNRHLRRLEQRMLHMGALVARTADDLVRYHGKMMIVDNRTLHLYGFNYTQLDLVSRSFGIVTGQRKLVSEALKLFEADSTRQPYKAGLSTFLVSPENARSRLATFIRHARTELLIYDMRVSDDQMVRLLLDRIAAGVKVRIIGKVIVKHAQRQLFTVEPFPGRRLHVRAIIRDGTHAFVGSQSLARLELDDRREIGMIVKDKAIVQDMRAVFERDWAQTRPGKQQTNKPQTNKQHTKTGDGRRRKVKLTEVPEEELAAS
jgi:phosphatidylserine/phosphatidylglycerophosphate/cardiolipin synthase-like enzyme